MSPFDAPDSAAQRYDALTSLPPATPTSIGPSVLDGFATDVLKAPATVVGRGLLNFEEDVGTPIVRSVAEKIGSKSLDDWAVDEQKNYSQFFRDNFMPAASTGVASQILVHGVAIPMAEMIGAGAATLTGPLGGAAYEGVTQFNVQKIQHEADGMKPEDAAQLAAGEGVVATAMGVLPFGRVLKEGASLGANAARMGAAQLGFNVTTGIASRYATQKFLEDRGYGELASQVHPFSVAEAVTDAALGFGLGYLHTRYLGHKPTLAPGAAPAPEVAPHDVQASPTLDDAMAVNSVGHASLDVAPGPPADVDAMNAQARAMESGTLSEIAGDPVRVEAILEGAHFLPDPPEIVAEREQMHTDALEAADDIATDRDERRAADLEAPIHEPLEYTPSDKITDPEQRAVEARLGARDYNELAREYEAIPETEGGRVLSTDIARELSPDYLGDRAGLAAAVHEPASAFIKRYYAERLARASTSEKPTVFFTAGGTGAGKSSGLKDVPDIGRAHRVADVVYDTNMNKLESARAKIDQAIARGRAVHIVMTYREAVDALTGGALTRAMRQEADFGSGRAVPLREHLRTHVGARDTVLKLAEEYATDRRVKFDIIDNTRGRGNSERVDLDFLRGKAHNVEELRAQLRAALEHERAQGRISEAVYRGFLDGEGEARGPSLGEDEPGGAAPPRDGGPRDSGPGRSDRGGVQPEDTARGLREYGSVEGDREGQGQVTPAARALDAGIEGNTSEVKIGEQYVPVRWMLVDAKAIAPAVEKGETQARDRTRAASAIQVAAIAAKIDFKLLGESPQMDFGAPTLAADGRVVGGNGRVLAINRAYDSGNGDAYANPLRASLEQFGIDPAKAQGMAEPMLVRVLPEGVDLRAAALASNEGAGARMSPLEQAPIDAERLPEMSGFTVPEDGNLNSAANRDFIKQWVGNLPGTEQSSVMDTNGALSQEGLLRLRNAILSKAWGDSPTLGRMVELTDATAKNISNALTKAAPPVVFARDAIAAGMLHPADPTATILDAVEKFVALKDSGETIEHFLSRGELAGFGVGADVRKVLAYFGQHARSVRRIADMIAGSYRELERFGNPKEADFFGGARAPTVGELVDGGIRRADNPEGLTVSLFGEADSFPGTAAAPRSKASATYDAQSRVDQAKAEGGLYDTAANCDRRTPA